MKTNQVMIRPMGQFQVVQRTKDGYFDANALLSQWNSVKGNTQRKMSRFFESDNVKEFIDALKEDISQSADLHLADLQVVKEVKPRNTAKGKTKGQVWMHPYLFTKFAMWLNPRFEVQVIKFVYDQMIKYRNEAGDAYRELGSAVQKIVDRSWMPAAMKNIAKALNFIVFGDHGREMRNKQGDEVKMRELFELERQVAMLVNDGFLKNYNALIEYLRRKWKDKYLPNVLRC